MYAQQKNISLTSFTLQASVRAERFSNALPNAKPENVVSFVYLCALRVFVVQKTLLIQQQPLLCETLRVLCGPLRLTGAALKRNGNY